MLKDPENVGEKVRGQDTDVTCDSVAGSPPDS